MKNKKGLLFSLMIAILLVLYLFMFINGNDSNALLNYLFFALIIVSGLYIITLVVNRKKYLKAKSRDKLFNSLMKNSDTIYIMMDENKKIVYVSDNIEEVLGIKRENKSDEQMVFEILNIPIIKSELKNWDMNKIY